MVLGIGDDAAVIRPRSSSLLLTTDMMVEGVHFDLSWTTPFQLGFKLVSVNVSDIFAMGGRPNYLLLNFSARPGTALGFFSNFLDGIEAAMKRYNLALIGGDISSSEKMVLSVTAVGSAKKILSRKGARKGDRIYITGPTGDAACGLALMKACGKKVGIEHGRKRKFPLPWKIVSPLIERHLMPLARDPHPFVNAATAMIDISDGLLIDLSRLCRESSVGARVYTARVPVSDELQQAADSLGVSPHEFAFGGGEDYELLFTAPADRRVKAHCIGEIIQHGLLLVDEAGHSKQASAKGYQHFGVQRKA